MALPYGLGRGVLEVEPVIAVDISKNILIPVFLFGCNAAVTRRQSFNEDQSILGREQAKEQCQNLVTGHQQNL